MPMLKSVARAALRIFVGLLLIAVPLALFKLVIMPALGLSRDAVPTEAITSDPVSFFSNIAITLAIIVLGFWVFIHWIERRPANELSVRPGANVIGAVSGMVLIGIPIAVLYSTGHYSFLAFQGFSNATLAVFLIVAIAVLLEEIFFRGIMFSVMERHFGTITALTIQSALFSVVHLTNDNWSGVLPVLSGFLIGCLWTGLFIFFRNIWVVALHHAVWNLTIFATGLPLSGIDEWRPAAPLHSEFQGSVLMSGGVSGPEVSILTPLIVLIALSGLLYWARKKRLFIPSPLRQRHDAMDTSEPQRTT